MIAKMTDKANAGPGTGETHDCWRQSIIRIISGESSRESMGLDLLSLSSLLFL